MVPGRKWVSTVGIYTDRDVLEASQPKLVSGTSAATAMAA
jgi:hypothetical protein